MNDNGTQYEDNNEAIRAGMAIVERTLHALHEADCIRGFAVVLDKGEGVNEVTACCPAHALDMVEAEVLSVADGTLGQVARAKLMAQGASVVPQSLAQVLVDMGFRDAVPAPSQERSEASDDESAQSLRRLLGIGEDPFETMSQVKFQDSEKPMDGGYL